MKSGQAKRGGRLRGVAILIVLTLLIGAAATPLRALESFTKDELRIETQSGSAFEFEIELALNARQWAQGLMFRRAMPAEAGMLFLYDREAERSMWMKNTHIPLDMLFIAADGRIESVVERTVPFSLEVISSRRPVKAVLEINGGTLQRLGIGVGDKVLHPAFASGS